MSGERLFSLDDVRKFLAKRVAEAENAPDACENQEEIEIAPGPQQPIVEYRMLEKMGSGGMGAVFKAEKIATGDIVALKLLYPNTPKTALQQFINEGMMLMNLDHPNILKGFDFGFSNGFYFLALECIRGENVITFLEKGFRFTEDFTFHIALQIARALAYLENKLIVHRDVKPANILLVEDTAKLCDFGLSLDLGKKKEVDKDADVTCGTVEYISPEQARGQSDMDNRSDVYSLGITCIHMITGRLPFEGGSPMEIMRRQIYEPIDLGAFGNISSTASLLLSLMVAKKRKERPMPSKLVRLLEKFLQTR